MGNDNSRADPLKKEAGTNDRINKRRLQLKFTDVCERTKITHINKTHFEEYVIPGLPLLCEALFHYMCNAEASCKGIDERTFVDKGSHILHLTSLTDQMQFYVNIFLSTTDKSTKEEFGSLIESAFKCALINCEAPDTECSARLHCVRPSLQSLFGAEDSIDSTRVLSWISRNCEQLTTSLHQYTCHRLVSQATKHSSASHEQSAFEINNLILYKQLQEDKHLLTLPRTWLLSCLLPSNYFTSLSAETSSSLATVLSGGWQLLYNSEENGLSVNRFQHHVFAYDAPTVTLFSFEGHCYCIAASKGWREDRVQIGGDSCYLIQLYPQFKIMQCNSNMFFFNLKNRDLPKGLLIGSEPKTRYLQIDSEFHKVKHYGVDLQLHRLETWGCGGMSEHQKQLEQKQWEKQDAQRQKDRKLKRDDWETSADRVLLGWGGVNVDHANTDRN